MGEAPTVRSRPTRSAEFKLRALLIKRGPGKLSAQMRMAMSFALDEGYEGIIVVDGNGKDDVAAIPRIHRACSMRATITFRARATSRAGGGSTRRSAVRSA